MYVTCSLIDRELQSRRRRRPSTGGNMSKKLRARACIRKRPRRVARMAAQPPAADTSPPADAPSSAADIRPIFIHADDWNDGCLVYGARLESSSSGGSESDDPTPPPAMEILRPSDDPLVCWSEDEHKLNAVAAVSGGATILGLMARSRETVLHDVATRADAPGPQLRRSKRHPAMLPIMGRGVGETVLVMGLDMLRPGRCCFQALRRGGDGGWRAEAVPDPPAAFLDEDYVTGYFAMGPRVWISVAGKGTLSLDTVSWTWRVEGTWELPLEHQGLFVPELGVVIGIARGIKPTTYSLKPCVQLCALDVSEAGREIPPVVRRVWEMPPERIEEMPLVRLDEDMPRSSEMVSLAYLGNGRFCISRSVNVEVLTAEGWLSGEKGTTFTLVDVTCLPGGELQLAKHGKANCHVWPYGHVGHATFLQPAF